MSLADFFTFDQPPREHQYVFRANEQPDLGRDGLRLLMVGAPLPSRQMRFLREQYAPGASSGEEAIVHAEKGPRLLAVAAKSATARYPAGHAPDANAASTRSGRTHQINRPGCPWPWC